MSAVFVSHDIAVVRCVCDRVMVLRSGRLVESGGAAEIVTAPREDYTKELIASILEIDETCMADITERIERWRAVHT